MAEPQEKLIAHFSSFPQSAADTLKSRAAQGTLMALRAVCAAGLAYGIGRKLHTQQTFWAVMTAIAVTQHDYADTLSQSCDQLIAAVAGGVIGLAAAWLWPADVTACLISIAIVIISCWCMKVSTAAHLAAITTTIVLLVPSQGPAWGIALVRCAEVSLGMACALPVSWIFGYIERRWLGL